MSATLRPWRFWISWAPSIEAKVWPQQPCLAPVDVLRHRVAEADLALEDVGHAGDALARRQGRHDAGLGGVAGMQRLGHRVGAEGLLEARGEGARGAHGVDELLGIETEDRRRRRGRAEAADGAGRVPVLVVRRHHDGADARRDLVADDDRAHEALAVDLARLSQRERGRDHGATGVIDRIPKNVVELDGVRGRAVDQGCDRRRGALARRVEARAAGADLLVERLDHHGRGRDHAAG